MPLLSLIFALIFSTEIICNTVDDHWRMIVRNVEGRRDTYIIHDAGAYSLNEASLWCSLKNGRLPSIVTAQDIDFLATKVLRDDCKIWLGNVSNMTKQGCKDRFPKIKIMDGNDMCSCLQKKCCGFTMKRDKIEPTKVIDYEEPVLLFGHEDCNSKASMVCVVPGNFMDQPFNHPFLLFNDDMHTWVLQNGSRYDRRMRPTRRQEQMGVLVMVICFACLIFAMILRYNQSRRPLTGLTAVDRLPATFSWRNNSSHVTLMSSHPRRSRHIPEISLELSGESVTSISPSMMRHDTREDKPPSYDEVVKNGMSSSQ